MIFTCVDDGNVFSFLLTLFILSSLESILKYYIYLGIFYCNNYILGFLLLFIFIMIEFNIIQ